MLFYDHRLRERHQALDLGVFCCQNDLADNFRDIEVIYVLLDG